VVESTPVLPVIAHPHDRALRGPDRGYGVRTRLKRGSTVAEAPSRIVAPRASHSRHEVVGCRLADSRTEDDIGRRHLLVALLALLVGSALLAQAGSSTRGREGGILRVGISSPQYPVGSLDPALSFSPAGWSLLETTCARLYTYPDESSPRSFRLLPEVASGYSVSKD
jgi:hypothetical protein